MTEILTNDTKIEAKLITMEDDLSEFIFLSGLDDENKTFKWPTSKLPKEIEIGETVILTIDFKNKQERLSTLKKRHEDEAKHAEMRHLLEELVN